MQEGSTGYETYQFSIELNRGQKGNMGYIAKVRGNDWESEVKPKLEEIHQWFMRKFGDANSNE